MRTKSRTKSVPTMMLHGLETRVMLSAVIFSPHVSTATGDHPATTVHAHTFGETLPSRPPSPSPAKLHSLFPPLHQWRRSFPR